MYKELNTIKLIREYMIEVNQVELETNDIDDMYRLFHFISNEGDKKFHSLYILNYLYNFIVSDEVAKRKTSATQLKKLFEHLQETNKYEEFRERLVSMFNFIFADDMILAIKDITKLELYFIKGTDFTKLIEENSYEIENILTIQ